jgi:hypothetical protein
MNRQKRDIGLEESPVPGVSWAEEGFAGGGFPAVAAGLEEKRQEHGTSNADTTLYPP